MDSSRLFRRRNQRPAPDDDAASPVHADSVTLDDADRGVLMEFVEQDARSGFQRAYARNSRERLTDEERTALPPLSFEDATLRVLIDVNKGFPEAPVRRTFAVLRELQVLRRPTEAEADALRRAGLPGDTGTFDVIDAVVFERIFPGRRYDDTKGMHGFDGRVA